MPRKVGTIARVVKVIRLGPSNYSVVLHGLARLKMLGQASLEPYMRAKIKRIPEDLEVASQNRVLDLILAGQAGRARAAA